MIYEDIGRDEDTLYTMLLTTGYLTAQSWTRGIGGLRCNDSMMLNSQSREFPICGCTALPFVGKRYALRQIF